MEMKGLLKGKKNIQETKTTVLCNAKKNIAKGLCWAIFFNNTTNDLLKSKLSHLKVKRNNLCLGQRT